LALNQTIWAVVYNLIVEEKREEKKKNSIWTMVPVDKTNKRERGKITLK
jgi:hypothetical protein